MLTTQGEACHWILSRLWLPTNPVPLPPLEMTRGEWIIIHSILPWDLAKPQPCLQDSAMPQAEL